MSNARLRRKFPSVMSPAARWTPWILLSLTLGGCGDEGAARFSQAEAQYLSATATASSLENGDFPAAFAVDGNLGTRWSSAFSDPQWIQLDFGATIALERAVLHWEAAYSANYDLQLSDNGTDWHTVYSDRNGNGGVDDIPLSGSGRFLRVYSHARGTQWGNSLWEIQVYPSDDSGSEQLLTKPGSAVASSLEVASLPANDAVDGNPNTRWSSAYADPQWLYVDLGDRFNVSRVKLVWEVAFGRDYQIQVSDDAHSWQTIKSVTGSDGGVDEHPGLTGQGRYVRMLGTARGTGWGYSLWEFEVYGTPASTSQCASGADCNDGNPCTADICNGGSCSNPDNGSCECSVDSDCNDGNTCTSDTCSGNACNHVDNGSCDSPDIYERFTNLSNFRQYVRSNGGSVSLVPHPRAEDNAAVALNFPGNPSFGPNSNSGPGYATEIALNDQFQYGKFETRLRFSSCSPGEEVVNGVFTYFNDGSDQNGNGLADNSEIDIEFLCGTPELLWFTVYTDYSAFEPGQLRKRTRKVNMRTGAFDEFTDWPPALTAQGTIPGLAIAGFPAPEQFYTLGFEWREGFVRYYIVLNGQELELFRITNASRVPRRLSEFLINIWHANAHWTDGSAADYPANNTNMLVDWVKIWR